MKETVAVHMRDGYDVDVTRRSKWGNPFFIGKDGTRKEVIDKYEVYIRANEELMSSLDELEGKRLGCLCLPKSCHSEILVKLVNEKKFQIF